MTLCVSATPGMLEQTQSPPLAQPTATIRRHRRRSSHHLLMTLPARPVSTSPYINPPYPTHRPRPVTPEDNQQPYSNISAVGSLTDDDDCNPIPRSQSVRLSCDVDGNAPSLRPLDILAPCPKKAGSRVGSSWQRWMAAFPPISNTTAPETDSRQSGRTLTRPLSFCFGESLDLEDGLDEMSDRIASLQREFSNVRQACVEAEAEAEALAPVVIDLSLSTSSEAPILDDLMRVSAPTTAPLPEQQPSSNATFRPKITIPTDREKQANRGPISAAGESAAMAELMGIFSNPSGSPTSLVGGELPIPPMPTLVESDNNSSSSSSSTAGLQMAIPATTPTLTAILEATIMGGDSDTDNDSSSNSQYNSDYDHVNNNNSNNTEQTASWRTSGDFSNVENSESTRRSRKIPPRLSVNTSVVDVSNNNSNNADSLSATSISSVTSINQALSTTIPSVVTLPSDTLMTSDNDEDNIMLERSSTPILISSITMLQSHLDDSINPGDIGRSPIVRTTNPVPLDWSFATTPRIPKHPIAPIGSTDVADDDDSDLAAAAAVNNQTIYNHATLAQQPSSSSSPSPSSNVPLSGQLSSETIVNGGVYHAMAAAATANFLSIAPPGRPSAPLNAATHAIHGANDSGTGTPPAGYQRPRSFSVSVASARTATLNRLGLRRV